MHHIMRYIFWDTMYRVSWKIAIWGSYGSITGGDPHGTPWLQKFALRCSYHAAFAWANIELNMRGKP